MYDLPLIEIFDKNSKLAQPRYHDSRMPTCGGLLMKVGDRLAVRVLEDKYLIPYPGEWLGPDPAGCYMHLIGAEPPEGWTFSGLNGFGNAICSDVGEGNTMGHGWLRAENGTCHGSFLPCLLSSGDPSRAPTPDSRPPVILALGFYPERAEDCPALATRLTGFSFCVDAWVSMVAQP